MCVFTVVSLTWRPAAISWLLRPSAIRPRTSASRWVSPSGSVSAGGGAAAGPGTRRLSRSRRCTEGSSSASPEWTVLIAWAISAAPASLVR